MLPACINRVRSPCVPGGLGDAGEETSRAPGRYGHWIHCLQSDCLLVLVQRQLQRLSNEVSAVSVAGGQE